jgi:cell division protein FtsN
MVLDYRERKPVNKNRPKSKPLGLYVAAFGAVACCSFVLGMLTDRFLLPPRSITAGNAPLAQSPTPPNAPAPHTSPGKDAVSHQQNAPPPEPSLTFYETLPKGGRAILGSGINPKRPEIHSDTTKPSVVASPHKSQTPPQAEVRPAQKVESPASALPATSQGRSMVTGNAEPQKASGESAKEVSVKKAVAAKDKFAVQVASVKERKEADSIKAALQEKGFAAYIVESSVAGKGTWYRVRVGKQMNQAAAGNLVNQIGKGAIIIPE